MIFNMGGTGGTPARRAGVKVEYDGTDISESINAFITSFSISEELSGKADSAEISMQDRPELWIGDWLPERGATMQVTLTVADWEESEDTRELPLGKFELDEIENSGPPNTAKLKMVSIPNNAEIRSVEKTRSWEKTQLSAIAKDIADGAGLELYYDADDDPVLERAEQTEQTDLSFLLKLCKDAGLALKVSDEKIIIFDVQKYEQQEPVKYFTKGSSAIMSYTARTTIHDVYKACHVKSQHKKKEELIEYTYEDPNKKEGMTLQVNEKVENVVEAEKLAKKRLREKNQDEVQVSITTVGDFALMASNTVELHGFHVYDGKYIIIKSRHEISGSGYTTKVDLRKCLNGY